MIDKAELKRNLRSDQFSIEVTIEGHELNLWEGIVEHGAKKLSNSELRIVYDSCNKQTQEMGVDNVPLTFKEMLGELNQTIINRKAYVINEEKAVIIKVGNKEVS